MSSPHEIMNARCAAVHSSSYYWNSVC